MTGKGSLGVALVVTRHAKRLGLPLDPDRLLTKGRGQIAGLGKDSVQSILKDHGITRVLAEEAGRTSRGSIRMMREYVGFLNDLHGKGLANLDAIEKLWIARVRGFLASKPLTLRLDPSRSLRAVVRDLIGQAEKRQRENPGATLVGTLLQHLVGAKLSILLPEVQIEHFGASVADAVSGRPADFLIQDIAIHVSSAPGEALIRKCIQNIETGLRPLIVTTQKGLSVAEALAEIQGVDGRIDIFEAEQFIAGNVYELGRFERAGRDATVEQLVDKYNLIVTSSETDPGLRIVVGHPSRGR